MEHFVHIKLTVCNGWTLLTTGGVVSIYNCDMTCAQFPFVGQNKDNSWARSLSISLSVVVLLLGDIRIIN